MNIIHTPVRFYPYVGGVENYAYYVAKELVRLGHKVRVVCAREPRGSAEEVIEGIDVKRLDFIIKIANTNITPRLFSELIGSDFDIIHTHLPTPWSADLSAQASLFKKKPLIVTYHNNIVGSFINGFIARIYNFCFLPAVLKAASKIIVTHRRYIDYALPLKNYLKKVEIVPVGVDTEYFKPGVSEKTKKTKVILFVSLLDEFHRYKGLEYLLKAAASLRKSRVDFKLLITGEGSLKKEYQKLSLELGLSDFIEFIGFIPQGEVVSYYNDCDIFVLPSVSCQQEGFGITLLEAMSCAKPVIASEITGIAEKIKQNNAGIAVKPKDVEGLREALSYLLDNEKEARDIGRRARKLTEEEYSWKNITGQINRLYEKAAG